VPAREELVGVLAAVTDRGLRASHGMARQPTLIGLACVARRAHSTDPMDRAIAAGAILREIIDALSDRELRTVARHLFGLVGGRLATKQARLQAAGRDIGHSWETIRKRHSPELLAEMADHLIRLERLQRTWDAMQRQEQVSSELALDWLRRFDVYSLLAYQGNAVANDLRDALRLARNPPDADTFEREPGDLLRSALHRWAAFSSIERRYAIAYSGIWLTSSREHSAAVVTAAEVFDRDVPFGYQDASYLRLTLLDARDYELESFIAQLDAVARGRALLEQWTHWASRCHCTHRPFKSCLPHRIITHGHELYAVMTAEWHQVAEWYGEPGSDRYLSFPDHLA
jgi:hypothetical protein